MVFGTTFSSQNLISETNKGELILKIDEGFYKFIKDPSNYGEINIDETQNIKIYPGLGITDICAIDLFIANRSSNMFSNNSHNCLERDLSDIDFISYTCLSENTIYDISLDNSFVEITIEYKANKLNKLNEIKTNDISVNRNSSKLKFFNSPKIFNNALKRDDYSKYLITPEQNDEYNIPSRDLSGRFNNLIYYKSNKYEGDISTSLYIDDTSAEILTPVQLLNYKLLEIQEEAIKTDPSKNVFFYTKNWGNYTHPLSGFHLGALAYNNLLYNDLSYHNNVFYNENSGNYFDEQTYRKLTIPHMANKYVKRINDISLINDGFYDNIDFPYIKASTLLGGDINPDAQKNIFPDLSLIYNSEFNKIEQGSSVTNKDKNLLFNIDNVWQHICDICFTDITYSPTPAVGDITADISYFYHEISKNFFNIFNEDKTSNQSSNFIKWDGSDFSCIKTKLGLPHDSIGRDCEIKIEYFYHVYDTMGQPMKKRQMNYFFKGYDLSSCFGFFNSEHNENIFRNITISGNSYDMSYIFNIGGDILSEPGLMESTMSPPINIESPPSNLDYYDLCGGKIKYKKKYGYTLSNFNINKSKIHTLTAPNSNQTSVNFKKIKDDNFNNGLWSFYTNNVRYSDSNEDSKIYNSILKNKIINTYLSSDTSVCDLKIKDILHSSYNKYLKYMDKNFFSFNKWINLKKEFSTTESNSIFNNNSIFNDNDYFLKTKLDFSNISILTVDDLFEKKAFVNKAFYNGETATASLITIRKDMYKTEPSKGFNINGSKSFSIHEPVQYHTIDDYINDISYSLSDNNKPLLSNSLITKYFSGGIYLIFRYIDFINQENNIMSKSKWVTSNDAYDYEIFPFISLGYNFNFRTKKYQLQVTSDNYGIESFNYGNNNFLIDNNEKFPELRVYARKARQDINTKKLLDIKEFDKIPLFLYKDPFVNNHHQFEITSKTIPTIYPALTCDVSSISINLNNTAYSQYKYVGVAPVEIGPWPHGWGQQVAIGPDGFQVIKDNSNILSTTIYTNGFSFSQFDSVRYYNFNNNIDYNGLLFSGKELWNNFEQPNFYGELQSGKTLDDATKYSLRITWHGHFFGKAHFVVSKNSSGPWIIAGTYTHPYLDILPTLSSSLQNEEPYKSSWNITPDISGLIKIEDRQLYNKKNVEEIYLTVDFTNSTNNLNNRFLSNFKTQLNKNNELLYFAQQNKNNPPIKFKIRNSNYDDFPYYFGTDNSYSIVNDQYSTIINDLISFNLPRFQYRPIYETINTNILSILNCNNNPDFSTNFGNKHFENLLAINNNKLPELNEEKYTYKLIDYSDNTIYNLNKIYKYDAIDLSSYSYMQEIKLDANLSDTSWQWLRYIDSWQKISFNELNTYTDNPYNKHTTTSSDFIKYLNGNNNSISANINHSFVKNIDEFDDHKFRIGQHFNLTPLVNPIISEYAGLNRDAFRTAFHGGGDIPSNAPGSHFIIEFDSLMIFSGFRQTGNNILGLNTPSAYYSLMNMRDISFYYFNDSWKEITNVIGSRHFPKPSLNTIGTLGFLNTGILGQTIHINPDIASHIDYNNTNGQSYYSDNSKNLTEDGDYQGLDLPYQGISGAFNYTSRWEPVLGTKLCFLVNNTWKNNNYEHNAGLQMSHFQLDISKAKINILEAFNDISTNYYDISLNNYIKKNNSKKIDIFPLYQNINIKIYRTIYSSSISNGSNYKLDLQLWNVSNMFNDLSNKYQIDFSNINCKGSNIFHLTKDISINSDWDYIYSEKLLRSRDFSFPTSDSIIDLSFSINITEFSDSNLSMINNNFLDFSYNFYNSTTNSTISNENMSNHLVLNFNYLTSRDNSENFNYYLNNVKNLNIIDNSDRNLLENYNNDNLNNFNMKMFDFETLHPKIHSNIINDNSKIDICPEAFLNCDLFFENNFNLYDESYNYYKINNTQDPNYLDMSNSKLNISELFEYKIFSSSNLIQDITKSIETFNFTPFTKKFINDISFYFSDNINYIYSNKYSPLNINVKNDLIPNVNLIDNNKVVYKNTILLPKDATNLFADLNFDKINCLMNFTKTNNCNKMLKNRLSLYDNKLLKFSAFNNLNNEILLNEMFMNSSINYFPYLLINSLKNIPNTSKIEAKDIITNCDNMYLNEYFLAIRSFSEVLDFDNNLKYTDSNFTNVEISWNLTNNKYFGGAYPLNYYFGPEVNPSKFKDYTINKTPHLLTICDSEKGIYWDYYIDTDNTLNCINKLNKDVLLPNTNNSSVSRLLSGFGSRGFETMTNQVWQYQDFSLNIYKKKEYGGFHLLGYNKNSLQYIGGDLYWSIGFLLKILGFTDLSNQTHYNKPISLNSKYEQRRKFLKEKMYKHNNSDQILDWYGVDDICCGQPLTNRDTYRIEQINLNFWQTIYNHEITSRAYNGTSHNPSDVISNNQGPLMTNLGGGESMFIFFNHPIDTLQSRSVEEVTYTNSSIEKISQINIYNYNNRCSYYLNLFLEDTLNGSTIVSNRKIQILPDIYHPNEKPVPVFLKNTDGSVQISQLVEKIDVCANSYNVSGIDTIHLRSIRPTDNENASKVDPLLLNNHWNNGHYLIVEIDYNIPKVFVKYYTVVRIWSNTNNLFRTHALDDYNNLFVTGISNEHILYDFSFNIPMTTTDGSVITSTKIKSFNIEHTGARAGETHKRAISLKAFKDVNYKKHSIDDYSLNQVNLFNLFPETSYCWLDLSVNLSYHDIYYEKNFIDKVVKPNMNLNIMKNEPFYRTDTLYDFPSKIYYANEYLNLSWLERFAINQLNTGYKFNDSPVFRYIYVNSFSTPLLNDHTSNTLHYTHISDILINVRVNNDQNFVLIDNSICELFNLSYGNMYFDSKLWFNDGSGIYTSIGNGTGVAERWSGNVPIMSDNIKIPSDYQDNSKKFPFLHFKSGDDISKNVRLDRLQTIASGISQNPNFWLKIDLGFILNKLYPNDFPSQTIALDRINYIYFYEGLQQRAENIYDESSNNLTYILSNINYSSVYEESEKNPYYSYYNNLLQPGFGYTHNDTTATNYINKSYNFPPPETQINDIRNYNTSPHISLEGWGGYHYGAPNFQTSNINSDKLVLYNYKVFNCNELNLFTYTNGFDKNFNMIRVDGGNNYKNIIDFDYFKTKIAINDTSNSIIPKNNKIGILIKGNSNISDNRIFTEILNNIGYLNSLKHPSRLVTSEDISNNTIRFDYTPYQNRSDYETREIKNYFIENYHNLIKKSLEPELHQDGINANNAFVLKI